MVKFNKQYLVVTEYTNYKLNIIYNIPSLDKKLENDFKYLHDNSISFEFNLGGSEYCADINIYSHDKTKAHIGTFKYSNKCNITETLEKGIGTRHLLNTIMSLIVQIFPNIQLFYLNDYSIKSCNKIDNYMSNVNLGFYYLVFYGNTWYGKTFKAKLEDINYQKQLDIFLNILSNNNTKLDYIEFKQLFLNNIPIHYLNDYNIELLYNKAENYNIFFKYIKDNIIDVNVLCVFMSYFLTQFMEYISIQYLSKDLILDIIKSKWIIYKEDLNKIDIKLPLEPMI